MPRGGPDLSRDLAREAGPAWGSILHRCRCGRETWCPSQTRAFLNSWKKPRASDVRGTFGTNERNVSLLKLLNVWELRFISKHFARAALLQELTAVPGAKGLRPLCQAFSSFSLNPESEETARSPGTFLRPTRPTPSSAARLSQQLS